LNSDVLRINSNFISNFLSHHFIQQKLTPLASMIFKTVYTQKSSTLQKNNSCELNPT